MLSLEKLSVSEWLRISGYSESVKFFNWFCKMSVASSSDDINCKLNSKVTSIDQFSQLNSSSSSINSSCSRNSNSNSYGIVKITTSNDEVYYCKNVVSTIPPVLLIKWLFMILDFGEIKDSMVKFNHSKVQSIKHSIIVLMIYRLNQLRKSAVLNQFSKYWDPKALNPISYIERNWNQEEFSSGCLPHGNIHWAGTETSSQWYGHMKGAITSSKKVVNEILKKSFNSKSKL
ncbi:hypothetical protein ACTFIU_009941 [Dictyostelium citrinum]